MKHFRVPYAKRIKPAFLKVQIFQFSNGLELNREKLTGFAGGGFVKAALPARSHWWDTASHQCHFQRSKLLRKSMAAAAHHFTVRSKTLVAAGPLPDPRLDSFRPSSGAPRHGVLCPPTLDAACSSPRRHGSRRSPVTQGCAAPATLGFIPLPLWSYTEGSRETRHAHLRVPH